MESKWFTYVNEAKKIFEKGNDSYQFIVDLCELLLIRFQELQSIGYGLVIGVNQDKFIDEVWNDVFERIGGKEFEFQIDKNKDREKELAKISIQKTIIRLLVLNTSLIVIGEVMFRKTNQNIEKLNDRVYKNKSLENLIETRRDVKRLIIDGKMNSDFDGFHEHLNNQIEFLATHKASFGEMKPIAMPNDNPYDEIFNRKDDLAFKLFMSYIEQYLMEPFKDFSFIFQKMKRDGLVRNITHLGFANWAFDQNFIDKDLFERIQEEGQFWALKKVDFPKRSKPYYILKNQLFHGLS